MSWRALACCRGVPPGSWWPGPALSSAVVLVLVALDVLIDGLPDHIGEVTVLSPCDLFELGSLVCVEAQAVVLREGHVLILAGLSRAWSTTYHVAVRCTAFMRCGFRGMR